MSGASRVNPESPDSARTMKGWRPRCAFQSQVVQRLARNCL